MLEVVNSANQGDTQAKFSPLISVTTGQNAEALDITVNMFNINPAFGNFRIFFLFFFRQFMVFGSLCRDRAVFMDAFQSLITFILNSFYGF